MISNALRRTTVVRMLAVLAGAVMIIIGAAPAASAHVEVSGTDARQGAEALLTFRVPTESDTASTTEVIINFPRDTPIVSVAVARVPGWNATVRTAHLDRPVKTDDGTIDTYVTAVDWRADSARTAIKPGQFVLFNLSAGPLPRTSKITFPTEQRYSNGTVVDWDQIGTGSAVPDHPAPALQLTPETPSATQTAPQPAATGDPSGNALGVTGVVLAVIAVVIAAIALLRSRHPTG